MEVHMGVHAKNFLTSLQKIFYPLVIWILLITYMAFLRPKLLKALWGLGINERLEPYIDGCLIILQIIILYLIYLAIPVERKHGYLLGKISWQTLILLLGIAIAMFVLGERIKGLIWQQDLQTTDLLYLSQVYGEKVSLSNLMAFTDGDKIYNTVLLSPIMEELVFRFYMNLPFNSPGWAIYGAVISSLFFALTHGLGSQVFLSAFLHSIIYFWVFYRSKNLSTSIVLHMAINALATIFLIISIKFPILRVFQEGKENIYMVFELPLYLVTLIVIGGVIAGYRFWKLSKQKVDSQT